MANNEKKIKKFITHFNLDIRSLYIEKKHHIEKKHQCDLVSGVFKVDNTCFEFEIEVFHTPKSTEVHLSEGAPDGLHETFRIFYEKLFAIKRIQDMEIGTQLHINLQDS